MEEKKQAQAPDSLTKVKSEIDAVNHNLEQLQDRLRNMTAKKTELSDEIDSLELTRAVVAGRIRILNLELEQADEQMVLNQEQKLVLSEKAEKQRILLAIRLRELYKKGKLGYSQILLKQSRIAELVTAYHYARYLSEKDHRAIAQYRETIAQLDLVEQALARIKTETENKKVALAQEKTEVDRLLQLRNNRLAEIQKEQGKSRKLFEELALQKEELNLLAMRLADEENEDPGKYRLPIKRYRGRLNWPVAGSIKRKFGVYTDPQFKTKRKQKGLDIRVSPGEDIKAIYSGRVIFADWFKSYGNLVIVDHGSRVTSFYAHNETLLVAKGDYVERDQVIAKAGDTGSLEGPFLHFEIRQKALPENPIPWLKPQR